MGEESRSAPREFQLETRHLAAVVVLIAILCISSFMLGRWVERQAIRAERGSPARGAAAGSIPVEEVNKELTYFRTLEGESPAPGVSVPPPEARPSPVPVAEPASAATAGDLPPSPAAPAEEEPAPDGFMVQVMATRDPAAARAMRDRLAAKGYRVSILEGQGAADARLRKVRVGPYARRPEAERAAKRLEAEEKVRTWIP